MIRNSQIAAAVGAALAIGGLQAAQAFPTPAQAQNATHKVFIAGSSAAANAVINYVESTICGTSATNGFSVFTTPTNAVGLPDFRAVSCTAVGTSPVFPNSTVTVYYRPEGGSAIGVLPVINNVTTIKHLNPSTANCTTTNTTQTTAPYTCTGVTGTTPGNGTNDSFGGGVQQHNIDIGVSDLEPGVFANVNIGSTNSYAGSGNNDPNLAYSTAVTGGDVGVDAAQGYSNPVFGQAFGFIVSANLHTVGVTDLPKEQLKEIYNGDIANWNQVVLANDTVVGVNAAPVLCNREVGSGTRAEVDIWLYGDGCIVGGGSLQDQTGQPTDNFQTIAELDCVNSHTNAIGYVSIDNFAKTAAASSSSFPSVWPITVSGVADYPSGTVNVGAGNGALQYALGATDDWFEASLNENQHASADGQSFYTALTGSTGVGSLNANVGSSYQVLAIPGFTTANTAGYPVTVGSHGVYVNQFTRNGNSCAVPGHG